MKKKKIMSVQPDDAKVFLSDNSPFPIKEAFKTLRTNVMFSLPGAGSKCIGITSANRGEGKSSVSIQLALSFAQINKKVIIIDCDMRLPTISSKLGLDPGKGLSDYLVRSNDDEKLNIIHLDDKGIDVVTSGKIPPDPTALLESDNMKKLIEKLKEEYDYIIVDFPPIIVVTDAVILADKIDGYLVVIRQNVSEFAKIDETLKQMEFANANLIGFVYNGKSYDSMLGKGKYYKYK